MSKRTKPRKWIQAELDRLDPDKDYDQMMKLNGLYRADEAFQDIIYSISMPNVAVTNHGALSLFKSDESGKSIRYPEKRMDHTALHHLIWFEFGSDHEYTKASVDSLNRMHAIWAKRAPEAFEPEEDYNYALAYEISMIDRLSKRVGGPGVPEREKRAAYNFYTRIQSHFRHAITNEPIGNWPESFEACEEFAKEFESRKRVPHKYTELVDEHLVQAFGKRHFPPMLQGFGRDLIVSISDPNVMNSIGIRMPSKMKQAFCRRVFRTFMWLGAKVKPDEEMHIAERIRARTGESIEEYMSHVVNMKKYHKVAEDAAAVAPMNPRQGNSGLAPAE
jgi:hypothetical protein